MGDNKNLKSTLSDPIGPPSNDLPPHSPLLASLSDANNPHKINANNKTINLMQPHKSKAHSKRARNRSLEMVIDDERRIVPHHDPELMKEIRLGRTMIAT